MTLSSVGAPEGTSQARETIGECSPSQVNEGLRNGDVVAMFVTAPGRYAGKDNLRGESHWEIPAAWKVVVRNERVSEWRVYADNEPVWKIMGVKRY